MRAFRPSFLVPAVLMGAACASPGPRKPQFSPVWSNSAYSAKAAPSSFARDFVLLNPRQYPDFEDSFKSRLGLKASLDRTILKLKSGPLPDSFALAGRKYAGGAILETLEKFSAILASAADAPSLSSAVRDNFDVYASKGSDGRGRVVFSSYYEPVLPARLKRSQSFRYPIYRKPKDLIEADLGLFDPSLAGKVIAGRLKGGRLVPYFSRRAIDVEHALAARGLEEAWLNDPFDVLDLQIQGSGLLQLPDGRTLLANYDGTNRLPYRSVGLALVGAGVFDKNEISREKIKAYLQSHPEAVQWVLEQNPRYVFFKLRALPPDGEPAGTAGVPLSPYRSVALDAAVFPMDALVYLKTDSPRATPSGRLLGQIETGRFALFLDTGGAIKGPGRVDIYVGHGPKAQTVAHNQWADGSLYVLMAKLPPP